MGGIEGICGGDYSADGHDGEANDGEENGVWREEEDDVAFSDAHVGERRGNGIDGFPELGIGDVVAGGGVDEGNFAVVRAGRDKRRRIEGLVRRERDWAAFAVEDFGGFAEAASWIYFAIAATVDRHVVAGEREFSESESEGLRD